MDMGWTKRTDRGVIREELSTEGRTVRMELHCGRYQGASPYFAISYLQKDGQRPQVRQYTPFEDRAEYLCRRFCEDVTDLAKI